MRRLVSGSARFGKNETPPRTLHHAGGLASLCAAGSVPAVQRLVCDVCRASASGVPTRSSARAVVRPGSVPGMKPLWGTHLRQRLRLAPLYCAVILADRVATMSMRRRPRIGRNRWAAGISVIIPDRDAPQMLDQALESISLALPEFAEPVQIIVVANGAPRERYRDVLARHPSVEFIHIAQALGFSAAIRRGLDAARHEWALLLNNDMTLEPGALRELATLRA